MKFLDRILLSKKLHIYLAVFLAVSVMFCVIFFMFQFQSYNTLERNRMLQDGASVSSRLLSEIKGTQSWLEQLAANQELRGFIHKQHTDLDSTYSQTSESVLRELQRPELMMDDAITSVAHSNDTIKVYNYFSEDLELFLSQPWVNPEICNINDNRVFWARGKIRKTEDALICYTGIYSNAKPYGLEAVVMIGIPINRLNTLLYQHHDNEEMVLLSDEGDVLAGNNRMGLSSEEIQRVRQNRSTFMQLAGKLQMIDTISVNSADVGIQNWSLLVVRSPQSFNENFFSVFLIWFAILLVAFGGLSMLNRILTKHIVTRCNTVLEHINQIASENFDVNNSLEGNDEFSIINEKLNGLSVRLKRQIVDEYNHNLELHQEQIKSQKMQLLYQKEQIAALHNQINPHYIVNTLESIRMKLLMQGDDNNAEMLLVLAESLQTYRRAPYSLVTIADELEFIQRYLMLQNYRFIHPITYHIEAEEALYPEKIPQFILQPLIENAIMHGFRHKIKKPHLDISFVRSGDALYIKVSDNGFGMDEQTLKKLQERMRASEPNLHTGEDSIGLMNVYWRLMLLYGQDCGMQITSKPDYGTEVEMMLNLRKVKENELQRIDH